MMIDEYTLIKCIGKGAFGEVYLTRKQNSTKLFATKKVPKQKADSPAIRKYFINELTILREINHKNIIHLETIKHTIHNYYIITEYYNGGGLSDCLQKYRKIYGKAFPEIIVQHIMRQVVEALKYLHARRIMHRDIKLDNILVNFENELDKNNLNMLKAQIKLIDFGFATHMGSSNERFSTLGSPINMDPILLKKLTAKSGTSNLIGYDEKADIWSLGTVCYELLIGQGVFNAENMVDLIRKVEYGSYHVPTNLSREVVSFLNGMLQYNSKLRLSAEELSRHHFLTKNVKDFKHMDLMKVCHRIDNIGLDINIKRNQSIWAIFKEEDEKALIDIPGKYLNNLLPIPELDEYSVTTQQTEKDNPFKKANNNLNNKNNLNNNNIVNNQINKPKEKKNEYDIFQQQQKVNYQLNNNINQKNENYIYNKDLTNGGINYNNYYLNGKQKYYNSNINGKTNLNPNRKINYQTQIPLQTAQTTQIVQKTPIVQTAQTTQIVQTVPTTQIIQNTPTQKNQIVQAVPTMQIVQTIPTTQIVQAVTTNQMIPTITSNQAIKNTPVIQTVSKSPLIPTVQTAPTIQTNNNIIYQTPQSNQLLTNQKYDKNNLVNQQQYQQYQYVYENQSQYNSTNNSKTLNIGNRQIYASSEQPIISQDYYQPSSSTSSQKYQNKNINLQEPIIVTEKNIKDDKNSKNQIKVSKISAISNVTTKTEVVPPKKRNQKYDNYYVYNEHKNHHNQVNNQQQNYYQNNQQQNHLQSVYQTKSHQAKVNSHQIQGQIITPKKQPKQQYDSNSEKPAQIETYMNYKPQPTIVINPQPTIKTQYLQQNKNQYQLQQKYKEYFIKTEDIKSKQYKQLRTNENKYETQNNYHTNKDYLPQNQLLAKIEEPKNNYRCYDDRKQQSQKNFVYLDINANTNEDTIKNEKINKNINKIRDREKNESQKKFLNIDINASLDDDDNLNVKINKSIKQSKNNEYKNKTSSTIKVKKLEESRENNKNKTEPKNSFPLDYDEEKDYKIVSEFNEPFPMPDNESSEEQEKEQEREQDQKQEQEKEEDSNHEDSSEDLDDLIDFKLGDELCPEPENSNEENYDENNDNANIDLPMKKMMERVVERPTIGVPPPGTDPNDNYECEDDYNNGIFQTNPQREFDNNDEGIFNK